MLRLFVSLFLIVVLAGSAAADDADMRRMRADFLAAEHALKQGALTRYRQLAETLRAYPLYPYLRYAYLRGRLRQVPDEHIVEFIETYVDVPVARRLRADWLEALSGQEQWATLLRHMPAEEGDIELECHRRRALYETGRSAAAFDGLTRLWLVGHSLPRACDDIFSAWYRSDEFRPELAWQRFRLAMTEGNRRLARYLTRFMDEERRGWAGLWLRVHRKPGLIVTADHWPADQSATKAILLSGIKRMAWQDTQQAIEAWDDNLTARHAFTAGEIGEVERTIGLALAVRGDPAALSWLAAVDRDASNRSLREWRVRAALAQNNWYAVLAWRSQLEERTRESRRWRYWQARALEALNRRGQAEEIYLELALKRSYYGFLSADRLGLSYSLNHEPMGDEIAGAVDVKAYPGLLRARELFRLDRWVDARREWYHATRDMADWQLAAAAKLAQSWGWHDRAIMTLARTAHRDDLNLRFPLAHREAIVGEAKAQGVDPALGYGIIRQESAFSSDARSGAGALGLMQLLPRTAQHLARRLNVPLPHRQALLDPSTNLQLGMAHLRQMLERYKNQIVAAAAYNAGAHRVEQWLPRETPVTADIWAETVPYEETRDYIQNVLYFATIYDERMGAADNSLKRRMRPVGPEGNSVTQSVRRETKGTRRPADAS